MTNELSGKTRIPKEELAELIKEWLVYHGEDADNSQLNDGYCRDRQKSAHELRELLDQYE